nr:retrovirus-related Pol polyprotein from transposon TNT 1-94 [Tanacetum cinerariifolium]
MKIAGCYKHTQKQVDILRRIVEQAKAKYLLDNALDFACKHAQRIQELLVYDRDTCPNAINLSVKKVVVTPKNKVKKVMFAEPLTSSSNIKQVVQIVLWYLDSGCSKHMKGNRSQLMNFVSKFLASKTKSWLWHRRLSHLNFDTLNKLAKDGLARGIPRLKFQKDHMCSACALGKSKKSSYQPKVKDTNQEKLYLLHIDLCGPMRVASINRKRYILVIVDDYSRFTWVRFLRSKDESPEAIIRCIKNIQFRLNATVRNVRTDNETEFVNQILCEFYENVGISHQTSAARTSQQNGVVERQNRTIVEAARTMLIFSKALLFLWAEAINTACYTQNRSLIRLRYNKTPYELMQDKKLDLSFFHVFGALYYPTNDNDDLGKLDAKADIGPELQCMTLVTSSSGLIPNSVSQQPCFPPRDD